MSYQTLTTNLGLAKIAAAIGSGQTISLPTIKLGDGNGNPVTPSPTQIDLVRVVYSGPTNSLTVSQSNPNRVTAELVVPANVGGFTVREAGIYDSAGTLIFVSNFPEVYKPLPSEGAARDLVIRIVFEVVNSGVINLVIDTNVTVATRAWVTSNFTLAALLPGGTTYQILRKKSNADGDTEWADPASGQNVVVDVIEENQTLAASQTVVNLVVANTNSTAVYIEGVRLRNNQFSINTATRFTLTQSYPAGSRITIVQNEPNGAIGQATTEVAGIVELATNAETLAGTDATRAVTPASLFQTSPYKGFVFVPLNDPTNPSNNNSNVEGLNVINFTATGNTTTTPYTGATQTANLASIVPNNAYMVLLNVEISCNTEEASSALTGDVYLYFRKNSTDPWRIGLLAETLYMTREANATKSFPIIFDYTTKTFQIYLYHIKGSAPFQNPAYGFTVNVLGYFIK